MYLTPQRILLAGATGLTSNMTGFGSQLGMPAGNPTGWVMPNLAAIAAAYDIYCNCIKSGLNSSSNSSISGSLSSSYGSIL